MSANTSASLLILKLFIYLHVTCTRITARLLNVVLLNFLLYFLYCRAYLGTPLLTTTCLIIFTV